MPIYGYHCLGCGGTEDRNVPIADRNDQFCCGAPMIREVSAARFRFAGRVTPGGGPDKFTADMLGIPLHDLPAGLRTDGNQN